MHEINGAKKRLVTTNEIAQSLIVGPQWVQAACKSYGMPHRRINGELQFSELQVFEWLWDNNDVDPFDHHEEIL